MQCLGRRDLDRICSVILSGIVVLSWAYVIYACRISAQWLLEERAAKA